MEQKITMLMEVTGNYRSVSEGLKLLLLQGNAA